MRSKESFWWSRTAKESRQRERLYAGILDIVPVAVIAVNEDGIIIYTNEELRSLLGYMYGELIGHPLTIIVPPENRDAHLHGIARYVSGGEKHLNWDRVEVNALHGNGITRVPITIRFVESTVQGKTIFAATIELRDATHWKVLFTPPLRPTDTTP